MKTYLNRIASMLGYVPVPGNTAASVSAINIDVEIDRTSLDAAHVEIKRLTKAALRARTIAGSIRVPTAQFATAELRADDTQALMLAEMRKQTMLLEVLAKQGDITVAARSTACADLCSVVRPATGAAASGLPG